MIGPPPRSDDSIDPFDKVLHGDADSLHQEELVLDAIRESYPPRPVATGVEGARNAKNEEQVNVPCGKGATAQTQDIESKEIGRSEKGVAKPAVPKHPANYSRPVSKA